MPKMYTKFSQDISNGFLLAVKCFEDFAIKEYNGQPILVHAAEHGRLGVLEFLLSQTMQKIDIESIDSEGNTALCKAAFNGHLKIVEYLLSKKANINHANNKKQNPLMLAIKKDHNKVVRCLLENKASVFSRDDRKYTPLMIAIVEGHYEIIKLLIEYKSEINTVTVNNWTPLMIAATSHTDTTELLISCGADLDCRNDYGLTAIMIAARRTNLVSFSGLLKVGAEINIRDNRGESLLSREANRPFVETHFISLLIPEYIKYAKKMKMVLKYLGLDNIWFVVREVIEPEMEDSEIMDIVYS